jgi:hypothetical protein
MFSSSPREELAPCDGRYESATFHPATITWGEWGGLRRGCWMLDVGCWMFDVARGGGRGGPSKNAPPLPHPLLHRMEERVFGCGVRLLRTTVLKDRAFLTETENQVFFLSPRGTSGERIEERGRFQKRSSSPPPSPPSDGGEGVGGQRQAAPRSSAFIRGFKLLFEDERFPDGLV